MAIVGAGLSGLAAGTPAWRLRTVVIEREAVMPARTQPLIRNHLGFPGRERQPAHLECTAGVVVRDHVPVHAVGPG